MQNIHGASDPINHATVTVSQYEVAWNGIGFMEYSLMSNVKMCCVKRGYYYVSVHPNKHILGAGFLCDIVILSFICFVIFIFSF